MPAIVMGKPDSSNKIYTINRRIDKGKVEIKDNLNRITTISAGTGFKKGDSVLVVNGVLVGLTKVPKINEYQV